MADKQRLSGGFWRRFWAMIADFVIIVSVYQLAGLWAYHHTHGHVRMSSSPVNYYTCHTETGIVGSNESRPPLRADRTTLCSYYFFGFEYNRTKKITEVTEHRETANSTFTRTADDTYYVDKAGRRVDDVLDIDGGKSLWLLFVLALCEGLFATSPGKWLLRLKVNGLAGRRANLGQTLTRNGLIYGGWAINGALGLAGVHFIAPLAIPLNLVLILWMIAPTIAIVFTRPDPFYDRWAGTSVVRQGVVRQGVNT